MPNLTSEFSIFKYRCEMKWTWVRACILGSIVAQIIGGLFEKQWLHFVMTGPNWIFPDWMAPVYFASSGVTTILLFSFAQYGVLRHHVPNGSRWPWVTAAAWFLANYVLYVVPFNQIPLDGLAGSILNYILQAILIGTTVSILQARALNWNLEQTRIWVVTNIFGFLSHLILSRFITTAIITAMFSAMTVGPFSPLFALVGLLGFVAEIAAWIGHFLATGTSLERILEMNKTPQPVRAN
jgi:hypothetical protein